MFDAIVVGVGTMGSAACAALARRGVRVLGLEQFEIPNALGSHHGRSRLFRLAYYEHADYVPLLVESFDGWKRLEAESGARVFHVTGGLYMGERDGELVGQSVASARRHGLEHELLGHGELSDRFPMFRLPASYSAILEPKGGFVVPELAVRAMADVARQSGAELHVNERVIGWESDAGGVTVRTDKATYRGARLVVTAGAWTDRIVHDLGVPLEVTRQVLGWVRPANPERFGIGVCPCWAIEIEGSSLYYGFPMMPGDADLKLALHRKEEATDPETIERAVRAGDEGTFTPALERFLPDARGPVTSTLVCMYTNSPDSHFIIDRHPRHERVVVACGFSGHGFKFAPVIGEALADLATVGTTSRPIGFLGLSRFGIRP